MNVMASLVAVIDGRLYGLCEVDEATWASLKHKALRGIPSYHHTDKDGLHIWPFPEPKCEVFRLEPQVYVEG